jgi:hypothetical protein
MHLSPIILVIKSRRMRWAGNVARTEESFIWGFGGENLWKADMWRNKLKWENNIKMHIKIGWHGVEWI